MNSEFVTLSDEQLEMVAGGEQVNGNATGQAAGAVANGNAGNGAFNALNLAVGGVAVAAPSNRTRQTNVNVLGIVL